MNKINIKKSPPGLMAASLILVLLLNAFGFLPPWRYNHWVALGAAANSDLTERQQRQKEEAVLEKQQKEEARQEEIEQRRQQRREAILKRQQEKKARQEEALIKRQQKEKTRQEAIARSKQERQDKLARQKQERQEKVRQEKLARQKEKLAREENLRLKREELARQKEQLQEETRLKKEAALKRAAELKKQEQLKKEQAREEEISRRRQEEESRQQEAARQKQERQEKVQQEKLARQKEKLAREENLRLKREELARQKEQLQEETRLKKEDGLRRLAGLKRQEQLKKLKEQEEAAYQEQLQREALIRQKQNTLYRLAQEKRQQERLKILQQKELSAKNALEEKQRKEARIKESRLQEESRLKKEAASKRAAELKKQEQLKKEQARQEKIEQRRQQVEDSRRQKEESARQKLEQKEESARQKQRQKEEAAIKKQQEEKTKQEAAAKEKQQREEKAQQEKLARQKEKARQELIVKEKQQQQEAGRQKQAEQKAIVQQGQQRQEVITSQASSAEEKALEQAKLAKHKEDQKKIEKVEQLWREAKRLYNQGMYEESIKYFQEIVRLEGNPRIKYTPAAKDYIEKAQEKIKSNTLSNQLEKTEKDMVDEVVKRQIPPYIEPPKRIEKAEISPLVEPPEIRKKLKKKISLDFDKVDLKSVILFLSQESGVNFIASQRVLDLSPKVSARFTDTPVDEVIKYITKSLGLVYRTDKEIVWIAHPEEIAQEALETRIYYLTKGGGLFTEFSPMSATSSSTGLGGSAAEMTKILTIEDTLKAVIPWPAEAKLTYDKRINALIVRNTPQNLQMLEDIIYSLDITPCQVLIEARFMEIDVTDTKELGLTWKINADFPTEKKDGQFAQGFAQDSGSNFNAFTNAAEGLNLTYKGVLTVPQFQTVLHAMEQNQKIKTLSSPRITTLNNQLATIKVVDEWIYPTRYEFEILQVPGQLPGQTPTYQYLNVPKDFVRRDVGILLKVVPSVGADKKTISLSLIPEVSEGVADGFTYVGNVTLPKFSSRNLSATVVVNSGDTVVLGGLIKESRNKTLTKVPILGDIPLLGAFFKKNTDSIERKNLLIFVTAKVLTASGEEVVVVDNK